MDIYSQLCREFSLKPWQIENTVKLIDDGNTIPFIARYRKEATGSLDDQLLRSIYDRLNYLRNMDEQKEKIILSITEQGMMTDEIQSAIDNASTLTELDDIYPWLRLKGFRGLPMQYMLRIMAASHRLSLLLIILTMRLKQQRMQ